MTNTTVPARSRVKMRIRVYRVDRHGTVTRDRGTVAAIHAGEETTSPLNPPCSCSRCRAGQAVTE
ncbi:hypothetical protein ACWEWI_29425 [Streptomyces sp. NPDC003753]